MKELPEVTKYGVLDMQVCVPEDWSDDHAEEFANTENPAGTSGGWQMKHTGSKTLAGCNERVKCEERQGFVHIMFEC